MAPAPDPRFRDPITARLAGFLTSIGLEVEPAQLPSTTFLPGLMIRAGKLLVDESRLSYPGDLLHEAGHLALLPRARRAHCDDNAGADGGMEMAAIAWSYAAILHLEMDPAIVFHPAGYKGGAQAILDNFAQRRYVGVPVLEWLEMTADGKRAAALAVPPFPHMLKWVNDRE
ncbi:MAG TPA: hypothetical protein VEG08_09690 [Terriglobales bacterium]|nr:hypothetical protein [Terriglobales bacterium]